MNAPSAPVAKSSSALPWMALAGLAGVFFLVVWLRPNVDLGDAGPNHLAAGKRLPPVTLVALTGTVDDVSLPASEYKAVVLNFWGTWCPPCRQEFPHLAQLADEYKSRADFKLVAVSCGSDGGQEDLPKLSAATQGFLKTSNSTLPTYADPQVAARKAVDDVAGFSGYPTTLVLDGDNTIRGVWVGYEQGTERQIASLVADLLRD